jgi:hypothetical protein
LSIQTKINSFATSENQKNILNDYYKSNEIFLKQSNISQRLVSELVYVQYDFTRDNSKLHEIFGSDGVQSSNTTDMGNILYVDNKDKINTTISTDISKMFSLNTIDISFPGTATSHKDQNIFNVIKSVPLALDTSNVNKAVMKVIENNNLKVSHLINNYIFVNNSVTTRVMRYYPDNLKFNIYIYPLLMDGDAGLLRLSASGAVIVLDGCMFIGFNDWDFDMSGTKSDITIKDVSITYEKKYITNKKGFLITY